MPHPAALTDTELLQQCDVEFLRRSGPGGQHRNKTETAVRLKHVESGIVAVAAERRSQAENRRVALKRLRRKLALNIRLPVEDDRDPSEVWQSRCQSGRISVGADHADFPALLAEAMDLLASCGFEMQPAAERLGTSASQLIKLLRKEPAALRTVNIHRATGGLRRLR
ncbi:MAG: peptide chain release factor family protein [Planctomycetaceae bacterium]